MASDTPKKTQGEAKMERYIEDLIRNKEFLRRIKKLRKADKGSHVQYDKLNIEQKAKRDSFDKELTLIMDEYELLRKRTNRLFNEKGWHIRKSISTKYFLDNYHLGYIISLLDEEYSHMIDFFKSNAQLDMCKIFDIGWEELSPRNKGEEIIYLNIKRQMFFSAFPVGIFIHPKASKRDVLDFVEKRWVWIENEILRGYSEKKLKYGKRKHSQKLLDFLWQNRSLTSKSLKVKLDKEFPKNGLAYYEIIKILQLEKEKRLRSLS